MIEYTNSNIKMIIDEYIHKERDRDILKRRYINGVTYEKIAEEFGLSVNYVKSITYKYKNLIIEKIKMT